MMEQRDAHREAAAFILRGYSNFLRSQQADFYQFFKKTHMVHCTSSKPFYPISVDISPHESASVLDIIESDNKILNKILGVFAILCDEIESLQAEAVEKHFVFIAFYGEFFQKSNHSSLKSISDHLESLISLSTFVKRCQDVVNNMCNQIVSLYSSSLINIKGVKLNYVLAHLAELLLVLVTLDCLIHFSPLHSHWTEYRKALKKLSNTDKIKKPIETLKSLDTVLNNLGDNILSDKIFFNSYHSLRKIKNSLNKKNILASEDYMSYLKKCIVDMEKLQLDYYESSHSIQWVKVNILFVFHFHIFGNVDKKLFKSLCDINVKIHSVPLFGLAVWHPEQFLLQHASVLCSSNSKMTQNILKARQAYVVNKKQTLLKDVYFAQLQSCKWSLEMLQVFSVGESQLNALEMNDRLELLLQGVKFASQINFFITSFMSIHVTQGMPITKSLLMGICKFIEILKGVQSVFKLKFSSILSSVNLITQHLLFQIISQLLQVKKNMMADKNYATQRLDELSAIVIAERALNGPMTNLRRIVTNVALSLVPSATFSDDNYQKVLLLLDKLDSIIDINSKMNVFCDCSFIYWHKSVIQIYLQNVFDMKKDMTRLKFIIEALNDCDKNIQNYSNYLSNSSHLDMFHSEIKKYFNDGILVPLSQQVETNLRLHVHSHLQLNSMNPFNVPVEDNTLLLSMKSLRFRNEHMSINNAIEHYLSHMFYNLTTVVLHDWKTYGEMRQLAKFKFNLQTVEDNLPKQTLEQGLDVLEIMRNIHIFVSKYLYNLNNQVFIEQSSNNKYLNTINIRHIANSIRTHGIGIMNTTVNFAYQFLRKKFHTFSQFMYDEQIKSRLIKDMRYFKEACIQSEQMYSYKRAEKFNKSIRNLGLDGNGLSYLDLFRILISEIGNTLGYVRMIRSGGLHCCANSAAFLPSLNDENYYFLHCENDDVHDLVMESLNNLESAISHLTSNFSNGTDYFKLLVEVFSPAFRKSDNIHLKSFFMIVPPLTLNFVEHMLLAKDKMNKKNKVGAAFTDDGFAMGLAYILKLLDQEEGMDSLNWFQSVNKHIEEERKSIQDQLVNHSNNLQDALALTEKKLNLLEQEFQLLYFSFSSARIFFQ